MIEINYQILIVQIISFIAAVFILWKMAWKPLTEFLINRRNSIENDINKAKESRENAIRHEEEYKKQMTQIELKAQELYNKAIAEGQKIQDQIVHEAQEEANRTIEHAKEIINRERNQVKQEMQNEIVTLAVLMAEKILKQTIDKNVQKKLVSEFVEKIKHER